MSRADQKTNGIMGMQPVLVDADGQIWPVTSPFFWVRPRQPEGNIVDYAVSTLGFIHIWSVDGSSIVVTLRPDLVHPKTMAAAFYAIADLRPVRVFVSATSTRRWELFDRVDRALSGIERLVASARNSSIGSQLLRVWENLRARDKAHTSGPHHFHAFARRRGDRREAVSSPAPTRWRTPRPGGKAAMSASGLAAPFLTRLDAVSSLSF